MIKSRNSLNKYTARLFFILISSGIICVPAYASGLSWGYHNDGVSNLSYDSGGYVDVEGLNFSLPGLRSAGSPNFENSVYIDWRTKKVNKGHKGEEKYNYGKKYSTLHVINIARNDFFFNFSPTETYAVKGGSFQLKANFGEYGSFLDGTLKITGVVGNEGDLLYGNGVLMTALLKEFSYEDDMIGFNTTDIDCPNWDFCTKEESVYLSLDGGGFSPYLKKYKTTGLAVTTVPVPAAVWLFGSGLMGLIAVARRENKGTRKA